MSGPLPSPARLVHVVSPRPGSFDEFPTDAVRRRGAVVWVVGELDVCSVEDVVTGLIHIAGTRHHGPLVLDLSRLSFMDAAGLKGLLIVRMRLAHRAQVLQLRNIPRPVLRLLDAGGCLEVFEVLGGETAAGGPA